MGNNVSNELPAALDGFLQDFAQMTGRIDYNDIIAFGRRWPSMLSEKQAAITHLTDIIREICDDNGVDIREAIDHDPEAADAANALTELILP